MCVHPAAEFKIAGRYPTRLGVMGWTSVGSVGEVDAAGEYFYDSDTGYYYRDWNNNCNVVEWLACSSRVI
jgi:hypothetical protein